MILHSRSGLVISMLAVGVLLGGTAFAAEPAAAPAATPTGASKSAPPRKPLDLRPPNITHLFTSEQLNKILAASLRDDIEEVQVQGERDRMPTDTPNVWPGIAAPIWALLNPSQSWRIFAPLPPDQTRDFVRSNATDSYVLEPAGVPSPHAH